MAGKRELIEPTPGDKRYVRRNEDGTFGDTVDVGGAVGELTQLPTLAVMEIKLAPAAAF